tara:strand:+ start:22 stop:552 length:531 start_codon:yes stop_codon:yes gene_type:complete
MVRFVIYRGSVPAGNYPNVKGASIQKPKPTVDTSERSRDRFVLRNAWNTSVLNRTGKVTNNGVTSELKIGAFRAVNNAGDPLSRKYYSCGGPNIITSRPGVMILTTKDGGQDKSNCDGSGVPPSSCNVKYVYDSSEFTKYKKLTAKNRGYRYPGSDYTYGGANNGTTQSVINRVRR